MKVKNNCKLLLALLLSAGFVPSAVFATSDKPNVVVKEAFQRKNAISGKVTDANGEPVIGASVVEKGTTNGVVTNLEGNFSLSVPDGVIVVISNIVYKSQEIKTSQGK